MKRVCVVNPDTRRCVFSDTQTGKKVVKKHGIIFGNCKYDEILLKCVKTSAPPKPKPKTPTPPKPKTPTPPKPKTPTPPKPKTPTPPKPKTPTPPKPKTPTPPKPKTPTPPRSIGSFNYIPKKLNPAQSLTRYLQTVNVNTCDLKNIFETGGFKIKSQTLIPKNSASDSIITKLDLKDDISIILKISEPEPGETDEISELYTEMLIYEFVSKFNLPFVINYVAHFTCNDRGTLFKMFNKKIYNEFLGMTRKCELGQICHGVPKRNINILITEACNSCTSLYDFINKTTLPKELKFDYAPNYYSIFIQLVYVLCYFEDVGLQHNDLHIGNIFIEETPVNLHLKFRNVEFTFFTRYVVRVFDYDRANVVPTRHNSLMNIPNSINTGYFSRIYCVYNENNFGKRDTGELFYSLLLNIKDDFIRKLIQYCLPSVFLKMPVIPNPMSVLRDGFPAYKGYKPSARVPCTIYNDYRFEILKNGKSASELIHSIISSDEIQILKTKLSSPMKEYDTVKTKLPSN